jgi:hypothetical protein
MPASFDQPVSFYDAQRGERAQNLALMRRIDERFFKYPFSGSRQMARQLRRESLPARRRVRRLMRTSLDLIQRSISDYVIHSTADIIGEVDSMLSRMP